MLNLLLSIGLLFFASFSSLAQTQQKAGLRSIKQVVNHHHNDSLKRLLPLFVQAKVDYPPKKITLLASKRSRRLELWADDGQGYKYVHTYWILHASGENGPKLREGDKQVPEGIYNISALNPNSHYHLSLKLNYPNEFDKQMATQDTRLNPGSNIFIHGKTSSRGCLAMGDQTIEDLFILVERVGAANVTVIIAPHDPRLLPLLPVPEHLPEWTTLLYQNLSEAFSLYQK